jgi:hypothetical protein
MMKMMKLKSITRNKYSFRDGRKALQHDREEAAAIDSVGQPRSEVIAQVGAKATMPWVCRRVQHLGAGAAIHG